MKITWDDNVIQAAKMRDNEVRQAKKLLPAWFVPRMMEDEWVFGLLLVTG
jgi:hypothetical protein